VGSQQADEAVRDITEAAGELQPSKTEPRVASSVQSVTSKINGTTTHIAVVSRSIGSDTGTARPVGPGGAMPPLLRPPLPTKIF
jgi:hypothetical protein